MTLIRFAAGNLPTNPERLAHLINRIEACATNGDFRDITQDEFGDIDAWLWWATDALQSKEQP